MTKKLMSKIKTNRNNYFREKLVYSYLAIVLNLTLKNQMRKNIWNSFKT